MTGMVVRGLVKGLARGLSRGLSTGLLGLSRGLAAVCPSRRRLARLTTGMVSGSARCGRGPRAPPPRRLVLLLRLLHRLLLRLLQRLLPLLLSPLLLRL